MNYVNIIVPAISALVGGLIAFLTTMSVTRSKAKTDRSKELMNLAVQAGIEAFKADMQAHRNHDKPMSFYIYFHYNYLHLVENGTATPENINGVDISMQGGILSRPDPIGAFRPYRCYRPDPIGVSQRMTEISEQLDFEDELQPGVMRFDLKTFDFYYVYEKQKIRLSEMGSGANWLACHLSLFLSLLHLSCKEKNSCIPSFLFIDQPSQVYFPKVINVISRDTQPEVIDDEDELGFDENIKQVKNIFKVILKEISVIRADCGFSPQIVVMEHADEKEFDAYVKKRWDHRGEKLI